MTSRYNNGIIFTRKSFLTCNKIQNNNSTNSNMLNNEISQYVSLNSNQNNKIELKPINNHDKKYYEGYAKNLYNIIHMISK